MKCYSNPTGLLFRLVVSIYVASDSAGSPTDQNTNKDKMKKNKATLKIPEVTQHKNMNLLSDKAPGVCACVAAFPLSRPNFLSLD